jgi:hypothetical protein
MIFTCLTRDVENAFGATRFISDPIVVAPNLDAALESCESAIIEAHQTHDSEAGTLRVVAEAMQATLALMPSSEGQKTAQREITTALGTALDARRQRIIISQSQVNLLKWSILVHAGSLRSGCNCQPTCVVASLGPSRLTPAGRGACAICALPELCLRIVSGV